MLNSKTRLDSSLTWMNYGMRKLSRGIIRCLFSDKGAVGCERAVGLGFDGP